jgi:hypothetical protein
VHHVDVLAALLPRRAGVLTGLLLGGAVAVRWAGIRAGAVFGRALPVRRPCGLAGTVLAEALAARRALPAGIGLRLSGTAVRVRRAF